MSEAGNKVRQAPWFAMHAKLFGVMALNLVLFYIIHQRSEIAIGDWRALVGGLGEVVPPGVGVALSGIVNRQLSSLTKARIVFFRWANPLPGSRAFTQLARNDPRVDIDALASIYGPLPEDPQEQNALWYKLYKSIESEPSVQQAQLSFIFARDYSVLAFLMIPTLGIVGVLQSIALDSLSIGFGVLMLQFLAAGKAARVQGARFVTTVLALKGVGR